MNLVHFNNKYMFIFQEEFVFDMSLYGCNHYFFILSYNVRYFTNCQVQL